MRKETHDLLEKIKLDQHSFLTEDDVKAIASDPETRLSLLLVRCGGGRFMAPADQVQHFIDIIECHQIVLDVFKPIADTLRNYGDPALINRVRDTFADYVRDISLPVNFTPEGDTPQRIKSPTNQGGTEEEPLVFFTNGKGHLLRPAGLVSENPEPAEEEVDHA